MKISKYIHLVAFTLFSIMVAVGCSNKSTSSISTEVVETIDPPGAHSDESSGSKYILVEPTEVPEIGQSDLRKKGWTNGAASLLYEDELHKLAESLESNLYVLPFMESEVFVISADLSDPKDLKDLTSEILEDSIPLDEKLSDQIYFYDRALRNLTLVTTTTSEIIRRAQSGRSNERIEKQSTIFDPDEVVKQLGKAAFARYGNDGMGGEMVVNLDDAIKIVKGDGVDDTCIRAENKESVSQTYLEALIAKYEGYTKLNEEKPLETNSYENGANNALLAVIADLKEMISRS